MIQWGHPIATHLRGCWPLLEGFFLGAGGDEIRDLAAVGSLVRAAGGTLAWGVDEWGSHVESTTAPKYASVSVATLGTAHQDRTIVWAGQLKEAADAGGRTIWQLVDVATSYELRLRATNAGGGTLEVLATTPTQTRTVGTMLPNTAKDLLIVVQHGVDQTRLWVNGVMVASSTLALTDGGVVDGVTIGARQTAVSTWANEYTLRHRMVAVWDRLLSDAEVQELTNDPWVFFRHDEPELAYYPVRPYLPAAGFPVRLVERRPVDATDPRSGVIIAAKARRIDVDEIELELGTLDAGGLTLLLDAWGDGEGQVRPFALQLPGEASARRVIFAEPLLAVEHSSPASRQAHVRLRDVTRAPVPRREVSWDGCPEDSTAAATAARERYGVYEVRRFTNSYGFVADGSVASGLRFDFATYEDRLYNGTPGGDCDRGIPHIPLDYSAWITMDIEDPIWDPFRDPGAHSDAEARYCADQVIAQINATRILRPLAKIGMYNWTTLSQAEDAERWAMLQEIHALVDAIEPSHFRHGEHLFAADVAITKVRLENAFILAGENGGIPVYPWTWHVYQGSGAGGTGGDPVPAPELRAWLDVWSAYRIAGWRLFSSETQTVIPQVAFESLRDTPIRLP